MTHLLHLLDRSAGWEQRVALTQLLDRLASDAYAQRTAALDPRAATLLPGASKPLAVLPRWGPWPAFAAPAVSRFARRTPTDLIVAWGIDAAIAARSGSRAPLVIQLFDPLEVTRRIKVLRTLSQPPGATIACACQIVRRRLIEGGVEPDRSVVIRPGVDFGMITQWKRGSLRPDLGVARDETLMILPEPVTRASGSWEAYWAGELQRYLHGGLRVLIPGDAPERQRIARFAAGLPDPSAILLPPPAIPFEQLLAVSDVLVISPRGDAPTTAVAWAMAAGVAVIGTAVHSVAELVANKVNGLLFKQVPGRSMLAGLTRQLRDRASQERVKETARGQAYEVFGLRRFVEQQMALFRNVLAGTSIGNGISDSAMNE